MQPIGYVVMQHGVRLDRPVKAYEKWIGRIPPTYREMLLGEWAVTAPPITEDPHCLALLKHYRSLMPLAMEARKPMFHLRPADGAIGAHMEAVRDCYKDFRALAHRISQRCGFDLRLPVT
jgi:chromosome partitioning protein